jgi:hypothetical protein
MHLQLTPVRLDKLTQCLSIPGPGPGREVGDHGAIIPRTGRPL